jgi:hypothetical protein
LTHPRELVRRGAQVGKWYIVLFYKRLWSDYSRRNISRERENVLKNSCKKVLQEGMWRDRKHYRSMGMHKNI